MCLNADECKRMMAAAEANNKLLTVFQNRRFDGDFLTVKWLMQNGALGDVSWIEQAWIGFGKWGSWRGKKDLGGGRIYDLGAHLIDQALQFFPQPVESVYCRTHYDWPDADIESEATIFINKAPISLERRLSIPAGRIISPPHCQDAAGS